jgi:hypothetical protein
MTPNDPKLYIYVHEPVERPKKLNKNGWLEPLHGRQKGRPKKDQKTCSLHEPTKGEN